MGHLLVPSANLPLSLLTHIIWLTCCGSAVVGQLNATVGSNVSVTLEVRCSGPVDLLWSYNQYNSTGLTTSSVTFRHSGVLDGPTFKCSIRQEGNKIVATFHLTNVTLQLGGYYMLIPRDRSCSNVTTVLTVCETTKELLVVRQVNAVTNQTNLTCIANSRCYPPCDTCRQLTDTTWYTRQTPTDKGVYMDASGNSLVIKSTTPDSKGYYCSANGLDSSNTFWHICPPDPNVTCGLDGQNTTILFTPVLQIQDTSLVYLYGNNILLKATLLFGNPTDYAASVVENLLPLNRERFLGILVIDASSIDRGVYNCNISPGEQKLSQTLKICELAQSLSEPSMTFNGTHATLTCMASVVALHDFCPKLTYLWLQSDTVLPISTRGYELTDDSASLTVDVCDLTTEASLACCMAWLNSDTCMSAPSLPVTVSPGRCDSDSVSDDGLPLPITAGVAVGGGVLIIAIAIVLAIYCAKRKLRKLPPGEENNFYNDNGALTLVENENYSSRTNSQASDYAGGLINPYNVGMPADNGVYSSTATNGKDVYTDPYAQSSPMTSASQPEGDIYSEVTSDNKRMPNVHSQVVKGKDKPTAAVTPINVGEGDVYSIVKPKDKHPASSPAPPLYAVVDKPKEGKKMKKKPSPPIPSTLDRSSATIPPVPPRDGAAATGPSVGSDVIYSSVDFGSNIGHQSVIRSSQPETEYSSIVPQTPRR